MAELWIELKPVFSNSPKELFISESLCSLSKGKHWVLVVRPFFLSCFKQTAEIYRHFNKIITLPPVLLSYVFDFYTCVCIYPCFPPVLELADILSIYSVPVLRCSLKTPKERWVGEVVYEYTTGYGSQPCNGL